MRGREGGREGGREVRERRRESHNTNYSQSFISNIIECPEVRGPVSMTESSLKWKQSTHHLTQLTLPEYTCNNNINNNYTRQIKYVLKYIILR